MKKLLAISLSLLLMLSMASTVFAADGEIAKTDTAPTIDGEVDAVWDNANAYNMPNYIVAVHDNEKLDPKTDASDLSGEWRALWDDNNFYLLVDITDPERIRINADRGDRADYDDSLQFFLQPNAETPYTSGLFHIDDAKGDFWHGPPGWASLSDASSLNYAINDYGDGYILEISIPWSQVGQGGTTPAEGAELLFDIQAVDNDLGEQRSEIGTEGRYPQAKLTWSDLVNKAYEDAAHLGSIVLAGGSDGASDAPGESEDAAADNSNNGEAAAPVPDMPNTGMGGADHSMTTAWMIAMAAAVMIVVAAAIRKFRSQT